jgi:type III secretion protein V
MKDATTIAGRSWLQALSKPRSVSDLVLTGGVIAIIGLMILPVPIIIVDALVAANVLFGVGLLLLAIYIPGPVAFASFPSVLLLTTLFRLSLAIAITRLILLQADAGHIIQTFGMMVVGGNLVVGFVVFLIITVVQFIVVAKGAERVAEVAARFTLDAMPGKQLSIDSDLRSGLIDKDEARRKRRLLEVESQLHGALDGAMKFVKGDSIAGIVIIVINILGGLAIGVMQKGMSLGDAVQTYSILTIGDGLVGQIPALLSAIAAGLIVTRSAGEGHDEHLGASITREIGQQPRVALTGGVLALLLTLVPGFPWPVFLCFGLVLTGTSLWRRRHHSPLLTNLLMRVGQGGKLQQPEGNASAVDSSIKPLPAVLLEVAREVMQAHGSARLTDVAVRAAQRVREEFGAPVANPVVEVAPDLPGSRYRLKAFGVCIAQGELLAAAPLGKRLPPALAPGRKLVPRPAAAEVKQEERLDPVSLLERSLTVAFRRQLGQFAGIQETANLLARWSREYPDLVKEMLRAAPPQRVAEILRRLLDEGIPIRHLRDVFEAITEANAKDRDVGIVAEYVRIALRRHITQRYLGADNTISALIAHPELEDALRQAARGSSGQVAVDPQLLQRVVAEIRGIREEIGAASERVVMLCSMDVRRYLRKLTETDFFDLPILSFQELTGDVSVLPVGQVRG